MTADADGIFVGSPQPTVSGGGSTITFSGGYSDSAKIESIALYSGDTLIGVATVEPSNHFWSLSVTFNAGVYSDLRVVLIDQQDGSATTNLNYSLQFGVTGQFYVTVETDYDHNHAVISQTFYRNDGGVYKTDDYTDGVLRIERVYYNPTATFASYELDYDTDGHLTARKYYGFRAQDYVTEVQNYSYADGKYTVTDIEYLNADGSLYEDDVYRSDGGHTETFYTVTPGRGYTSYSLDFNADSTRITQTYYGVQGSFYTTVERDLVWNTDLGVYQLKSTEYLDGAGTVLERIVYGADGSRANTFYNLTGRPYTSSELDYDPNNSLTTTKYFGYKDQFYTSVVSDFATLASDGQQRMRDATFYDTNGAVVQREQVVYDTNGGHVGLFTDIVGKPYTTSEFDYDANNHYTTIKRGGFNGLFYASAQYDYDWSTSQAALLDAQFFRADDSLAEKIVYNPDGSHTTTLYPLAPHA